MIDSFINEVAGEIKSKHESLQDIICILPSKRAGTFLKNAFLNSAEITQFAPRILSIETFVEELANIKLSPNLQVLFEFYEVYKELHKEEDKDNFSTFCKWGQIALQDFNEIDRYLIDPDQIFNYLSSIKELNHWTLEKEKTELQLNYLKFWNRLQEYYHRLQEHLIAKNIGYQGLVYREAIENLEYFINANQQHTFYFIGFNALNNAESAIIQEFLANTSADIYWDIDKTFVEDREHDAGLFIREYLNSWSYFNKNNFKYLSEHYNTPKEISIVGVPKNIGQANYIGKILRSLQDIKNTAVIMGNEELLIPILNALPENVTKANITSGIPLQQTPVATFFKLIIELEEKRAGSKWHHKDVIKILSHSINRQLLMQKAAINPSDIIDKINTQNLTYVTLHHIEEGYSDKQKELLKLIFNDTKAGIADVVGRLIALTYTLKELFSADDRRNVIFLEYLFRFNQLFNQLNTLNSNYNSISDIKSLREIYSELLAKETIDFQGEPLEGLQIMGVLESRNLDFETVIISAVNEGILPSGKTNNSFLSFDIKKAFGLPTYKEKDAVYTYHFYRILQRAKNIYLIYNTEPDVLDGGEKSRFIHQLTMLPEKQHHISEYIASPKTSINPLKGLVVQKTPLLLDKLQEIAQKGFSPSSLTNYIRNPMDFYHQTILGIRDVEEVEENIAANTLGTIVHNTLEDLYTPLEGHIITLEAIKEMRAKTDKAIKKHFDQEYRNGSYNSGKNLISFHIAKRYVENFLNFEIERLNEGKQIKIIANESKFRCPIEIPELNKTVYLKGIVDRIEEVDGVLHIIDYKTGKVNQADIEIADWADLTSDYKYSKAFQVLCYAYMLNYQNPLSQPTEVGIISFKNLGNGYLRFAKKDKPGRGAVKQHLITGEILSSFETEVKLLIRELFNENIPFTEKEIH